MKKILYIMPGWEEKCNYKPYQLLANVAKKNGYEVIHKNIDWKKPLSSQIFSIPHEAVLFGFSLGAILAWLVAQKNPCRHLILASMTPRHNITDPIIKKTLIDLAGKRFVEDVITHLKSTHQAKKQTIIYGDREEETADIIVPKTGHRLNNNYIAEIAKIL